MRFVLRILAALLTAAALTAAPAENADLQALREQVRALEQQLKVLARQIEIREEAATAAAPTTPKITVSDKGFTLASPDGANSIKLRGLVQFDSRVFFGDGGLQNNTFIVRRARTIIEGTFAKNYSFQIVPEFGGGSATAASAFTILDATLGIKVTPQLQFKIGKFKTPVGLELLQSDSWTFFNERSLVTLLVPNRDIGIQASGDVLDGKLNYAVGIFNGVADAATSTNADFDNEKDFVARLFATPFKNDAGSVLQGLSLGVAGSVGREKGTAGRSGGYRTDGQQSIFSYLGTVVADGESWRVSPQFDYRFGPFGVIGEYVVSTVNVRPSATGAKAELSNKAWEISAGYVLTGEDSSYNGVVPATNFDVAAGTWGAFEVVGRISNLKIDDATFPAFASPSTNANEIKSAGVGFNWYLSKTVAIKADYYQVQFGFNAAAPAISANPLLQQDEKAFISRFQVSF